MISFPDLINGTFEWFGGAAIIFSIVALHKAKIVRGVSWPHVSFFTSWGVWNLYYYWALSQGWSWLGGVFLASMNAIWLCQIIYYRAQERRASNVIAP